MDLQLKNKVALVTGSSGGIGFAIARALVREDASVIVRGRDEQGTREAAAKIGQGTMCVIGDLKSDAIAQRVFSDAEAFFGRLDILVNNAGTYSARSWLDTTPETWREFYEVDVLSAIRLILLAVPRMKNRGWGRIIQIATGMASTPKPVMPDYAAAKAAMVN